MKRFIFTFLATVAVCVSAIAQSTPINNPRLTGTGTIGNGTQSAQLSTVTLATLSLNGGTWSLSSGTVTGSAGIIPLSLVSGAGGGSVTGMTLTLGGALTGSLTNTASVPAITLTLSTFPAASLSGTLFMSSVSGQTPFAVTPGSTLAFAAGTNVTLTLTGGILTINSTGGGGGVSQVTGTTGRVTVTNTTSTPMVTLPTTLTLSDTTQYIGQIYQTGSLSWMEGALYPQANSVVGQDLALSVGSVSTATPFSFAGTAVSGGLRGTGPAIFPGGSVVGPLDTFSAFKVKMQTMLTTSTSSVTVFALGDSVATKGISYLALDMQTAYGSAGVGFNWFNINDDYSYTESVSGTATYVTPLAGSQAFTFGPHWATTGSNSTGSVSWPGTSTPPFANRIVAKYAVTSTTGGTISFSVASYSAPSVEYPVGSAVSASTSGTAALGTISISVPIGRYYLRARSTNTSDAIVIEPDWNVEATTAPSGIKYYALSRGGISAQDLASMDTNFATSLMTYYSPDVVTVQFKDDNTTWYSGLTSISSTFGSSKPYLIIGTNPSGTATNSENTQSTVNVALANAIASSFAQKNGYLFFDEYPYAKSYANIYASGGMTDTTHPAPSFEKYLAPFLEDGLGVFSLPGGTSPRGFVGQGIVTGSLSFAPAYPASSGNGTPLSAVRTGYLSASTPNDPTSATMSLGFLNTFSIQTATGSNVLTFSPTSANFASGVTLGAATASFTDITASTASISTVTASFVSASVRGTLGTAIIGGTMFLGLASNTISFSDQFHYVRVNSSVLELSGSSNGVQVNSGILTASSGLYSTGAASFASTIAVTGTTSAASLSAGVTSMSSARVGATGSAFTVIRYTASQSMTSGVATFSDTGITAGSMIVPISVTPNGTKGALFLSGKTAGASFSISSTSASDTSSISAIIYEP